MSSVRQQSRTSSSLLRRTVGILVCAVLSHSVSGRAQTTTKVFARQPQTDIVGWRVSPPAAGAEWRVYVNILSDTITCIRYHPLSRAIDTVATALCALVPDGAYFSTMCVGSALLDVSPIDTTIAVFDDRLPDIAPTGEVTIRGFGPQPVFAVDSCIIKQYGAGSEIADARFDPRDPAHFLLAGLDGLFATKIDTCLLPGVRAWDTLFLGATQKIFFPDASDTTLTIATPRTLKRSADNGKTWIDLAPVHANAVRRIPRTRTLIVAADSMGHGGILRSTDDGNTFVQVYAGDAFALDIDPRTGWVIAGAKAGVLVSRDSGATFDLLSSAFTTTPVIAVAAGATGPNGPLLAATNDGLYEVSLSATAIHPGATMPSAPAVAAFPNPFGDRTKIRITPSPLETESCGLWVLDILGRRVGEIPGDGAMGRGVVVLDARHLPPGAYHVQWGSSSTPALGLLLHTK